MTGAGQRAGARAARRLAEIGDCVMRPGLSEGEFGRIEAEYGIEFADDHRAFLAAGLPVGSVSPPEEGASRRQPWVDWRDGDPAEIRRRLSWPVEGLLFSVEHGWWHGEAWGPRPSDTDLAVIVARDELASVPQLIPVYSHRYLPPGRGTFGHPVLSVHGADTICYGRDLRDYVDREFVGWEAAEGDASDVPPSVRFWSDLVS
ncbi:MULTISPECIES: hypothetical protein [unclassified Streptomyces]|uniref:hypothetical protein n=1 Tax=unclassified Streptomyces TaxID=2593676 RepID=UPI002DD9FB8B|nr:hypothetical protein [Streptomyces sp. NBC_01237]WRZ76940.1 hypothetical protein OG251_22450 [Streptomyces sp. NBC_01237]